MDTLVDIVAKKAIETLFDSRASEINGRYLLETLAMKKTKSLLDALAHSLTNVSHALTN